MAFSTNADSPTSTMNTIEQDGGEKTSLNAAADLIKTLDSAFAEMSSLSTSAAKDAEGARRNARAASEVARRYTARSYPAAASFEPDSPVITNGSSSPQSSSSRKRKINNKATTPSTSERLAQSHAEDVLSLSLELERTKQELENEQMAHDSTRSGLTQVQSKNVQFQGQVQKLLVDLETQRQEHGCEVNNLHDELERARGHVQAAEEDAQLALDLAKGNAESREQLESWLQKALQEVQMLRDQLDLVGIEPGAVLPSHNDNQQQQENHVRFAEAPTVMTVPNRHDDASQEMTVLQPPDGNNHASRSMVAAGRELLQRASTAANGHHATPRGKEHSIVLTTVKSLERRQHLRDRLRALGEEVPTPLKSPPPPPPPPARGAVHGIDMGLATKAMETCQSVANAIRDSGRRLGLSGHWWSSAQKSSKVENVDTMAKQYCSSVEAKILRQRDEIKELESLCDYLEGKLVTGNGG